MHRSGGLSRLGVGLLALGGQLQLGQVHREGLPRPGGRMQVGRKAEVRLVARARRVRQRQQRQHDLHLAVNLHPERQVPVARQVVVFRRRPGLDDPLLPVLAPVLLAPLGEADTDDLIVAVPGIPGRGGPEALLGCTVLGVVQNPGSRTRRRRLDGRSG